ncbi:hypothetical protein [Bradyrhizobium genosp. P]
MTAEIFWHRRSYELFLGMQAFAELMLEPLTPFVAPCHLSF